MNLYIYLKKYFKLYDCQLQNINIQIDIYIINQLYI